MTETLKGLYKREPKAERPKHILVENENGDRRPITFEEYLTMKVSPHWRQLPWESDFKKHIADDHEA